MTQVHFYTLDQISDEKKHLFVCQLTHQFMQQKQPVLVLCQTQAEAEQLDELLWQQPPEAFIPHNLQGEGPHYGTPVVLAWPTNEQDPWRAYGRRSVAINLSATVIAQAHTFTHIVELVPVEPTARAEIRERYKHYRQLGLNLTNQAAQLTFNEGSHG